MSREDFRERMLWVRDPNCPGRLALMTKEAHVAMLSPPQVLGAAGTAGHLIHALERLRHEVACLDHVDVERVEIRYEGRVAKPHKVIERCPIVGGTALFVANLDVKLDAMIREALAYDTRLDEILDERDALRAECEELTKRLAAVRSALHPTN